MTEQEKREKAIEEMKKLFCYNYPTMCKACCFEDSCLPQVYSERLYDAGYRKSQEIFAKCKEKCMFQGYPYGIDYTELVEIFKEFGVEVEE